MREQFSARDKRSPLAWIYAGGTHHTGFSQAFGIDYLFCGDGGLRVSSHRKVAPSLRELFAAKTVHNGKMTERRGAVLWDLDGTLVDSEEYHWLAWKEILNREGIPLTYAQFLSGFGQRNDAILRAWLGEGISLETIGRIADTKEAHYRELVRANGLSPLPGAAEWVEHLHQEGWPQAIASSAPRLNVEAVLDALHLRKWFQATVSGEDVQTGKPDPQVFLVAASRLNAAPGICIVVEDAWAGVEAARRAGMLSIGVGKNAPTLGADLTAAKLSDLPADSFSSLLATASYRIG